MDLVNFLGWEYDNGIYRSEEDGRFYRVVDDKLEIYDPNLLEWGECNMPINEYSKLKLVEEVGLWSEGFAVRNEEEWELVISQYLQKDFNIPDSTKLGAKGFIKNNVVFYAFSYYGRLEITVDRDIVKRDLVLKPIKCPLKFYAKYAGKADFGEEMYWRINSDGHTVSLLMEKDIVNWHDVELLCTLKAWERCGITTKDAIFTTASGDKINKVLVR